MQFKYIILFTFFISMTQCVPANKNISIVTGIAPIASLIKTIAGDNISVTNIIPNNIDPHNFQLKGSDALMLANAKVVIALDEHLDSYLLQINDLTNLYTLNQTNEDSNLTMPQDVQNHDDHDHDHEGHDHTVNSHLWLSYHHMEDLASSVLSILIFNYPDQAESFTQNYQEFIQELQDSYNKMLALKTKDVYVVQRHASWDYLLEELGVNLLATMEETEGSTASLQKILNVVAQIEELPENSTVKFIDDAFASESSTISQLAEETSSQKQSFNPMATPEGNSDNITLLEYYSTLFLK